MKRHSILGIISCLLAIAVWIYFAVAFYLIFYVEGVNEILSDLLIPESRGMTDFRGMGMAIVIYAAIFFFIPVIGHMIGLVFAIIGLCSRSRRKLFPVVGIGLNLLPVVVLSVLYLIGGMFSANEPAGKTAGALSYQLSKRVGIRLDQNVRDPLAGGYCIDRRIVLGKSL